MIMSGTLSNISPRLHEVNVFLSTYGQGSLSFGQALLLSLFYRDFSDTNIVVEEAESLAEKDTEQLLKFSSALFSESETYLSLDKTSLQAVNFEALFEEYLKPFELRYEEAKAASTELWRKYSALNHRLDFLPLDSEEYMKLSVECDAQKAEYDTAHAQTDHLYNEWQQERSRYFCVYCFKPMFLDVLVERLHGIAESILSDINQICLLYTSDAADE